MRFLFRLLCCLGILVLMGCVPIVKFEGEGVTLPVLTSTPTPTVRLTDTPAAIVQNDSPGEEVNVVPTDPALQPLVQQAKEDLAGRLKVPVEEIELVSIEVVVWSDTSLGCPQPGKVYLQVLQDGSWIQLIYDGQVYSYHSGGMRDLFLCEQTNEGNSTSPKIDLSKKTPPPRDTGDR